MLKTFLIFRQKPQRRWDYGLLSLVVAITIILTTPSPSYSFPWGDLLIQGIQVIQISNLSDKQEVEFGRQINQELVKSGKISLLNRPQLNDYLNQIGQRLVATSTRSNIPYTFQIVNDGDINAFATMGGFVYLNAGLLRIVDNEAELASVMAHEIGHIAERHALNHMKDAAISQGLMTAAGLDKNTIVQLGVQLIVSLPNSRDDEFAADRLGLANLERAGYAPSAMVSFMSKLLKKGNSAPEFLSSHPATQERIASLEKAINPQTANQGNGLDKQAYKNKVRL
jgi:predicted Zn-dependent protease